MSTETKTKSEPRCQALIYKRDTYRYSGRGNSGFSMHYNRDQCSRRAINETGFCKVHQTGAVKYQHASEFIDLKHVKGCELGDNWKECPACLEHRQPLSR